jgi:hypothetical protein
MLAGISFNGMCYLDHLGGGSGVQGVTKNRRKLDRMCIGKCGECKTRCKDFLERCLERIGEAGETELKDQERKKEDDAMSVGGCHAGTEEKIGRLDERVNTCRRIAVVSLAVAVIAGVLSVWLLAKL